MEDFSISLNPFRFQRENMIREQIKARGIKDPAVLKAMSTIPREKFITQDYKAFAYHDGSLPIGAEQTISQPYIVALMAETLALTKESKVLEVGTGSGYNAAVLSYIAGDVFSVEIIPTLYLQTKERLERMGYKNIHLILRDGNRGWAENGPYDGIMITAATPKIPQEIFNQLKLNAILVAPVGEKSVQSLIKYRKGLNGKIYEEDLIPVRFVPLLSMKSTEQ
jgi:protein-L-isoaspartate(D-aspartate) O-methyltransferase